MRRDQLSTPHGYDSKFSTSARRCRVMSFQHHKGTIESMRRMMVSRVNTSFQRHSGTIQNHSCAGSLGSLLPSFNTTRVRFKGLSQEKKGLPPVTFNTTKGRFKGAHRLRKRACLRLSTPQRNDSKHCDPCAEWHGVRAFNATMGRFKEDRNSSWRPQTTTFNTAKGRFEVPPLMTRRRAGRTFDTTKVRFKGGRA